MGKIWFVTGCSTGFGKELAKYAAQKGDTVVGTLRKSEQIEEFNKLEPGKTFGVLLDVTNNDQIKKGVDFALEKFGKIDVLVNNAGYGSLGSVEETDDDEMVRQFDVNVFGAVKMVKAVLPSMRKQRSGHILNITSIAGIQGFPGVGIYNGSKFALEGIGEALAADVKHLGIKVINIEPGPFRTDWAGRSANFTPSKIEDYKESAAQNMNNIANVSGKQVGDPVKAVKAMYEVVELENPPIHLPLGAVAYQRFHTKINALKEEIEKFEYIGKPTDFTEEELAKLDGK
ncbi:oxidoreductase [Flexithrix dorotheae]|uniref:oxidoreductase n=1 Tax=Flexithrix dorotheae TaxID=70993 RepID=UPI0003723671|nr:oxidoreductase [Flexithrix dorotheae]